MTYQELIACRSVLPFASLVGDGISKIILVQMFAIGELRRYLNSITSVSKLTLNHMGDG